MKTKKGIANHIITLFLSFIIMSITPLVAAQDQDDYTSFQGRYKVTGAITKITNNFSVYSRGYKGTVKFNNKGRIRGTITVTINQGTKLIKERVKVSGNSSNIVERKKNGNNYQIALVKLRFSDGTRLKPVRFVYNQAKNRVGANAKASRDGATGNIPFLKF